MSQELDLFLAHYWGRVGLADFVDIYGRYRADRLYRLGRLELIDHSGLVDFAATYSDVRALLMMMSRGRPRDVPPTRTAIWAPGDVPFGMARMYKAVAEFEGLFDVSVHREENKALQALELPFQSIAELQAFGAFSETRSGASALACEPFSMR